MVDLAGREGDKVAGSSFGMRHRLDVAASLVAPPIVVAILRHQVGDLLPVAR